MTAIVTAIAVNGQRKYKDQLKLMRAETAASWFAMLVAHIAGESKPASSIAGTDEDASHRRYYGAFHV